MINRRFIYSKMIFTLVTIILLTAMSFATPLQYRLGQASEVPAAAIQEELISSPAPAFEVKNTDVEVSPIPQTSQETPLLPYKGPVTHIFFHPLIAYPELAFDGDYISNGYNEWFVTVKEFKAIVESLYHNNFILIDINSLYEIKEEGSINTVVKRELLLPEGKKPLILSIDDMNYYEYMIENGNVHKLVLDGEGNTAAMTRMSDGSEQLSFDNEVVPIVDEFVKQHPDFSYQGAKGIIALTGFEGILGYRTQKADAPSEEKEKLSALISHLKATGWSFASHSYGHPDLAKISLERLKADTLKWKKEVKSFTGPTSVYIYPYGSAVSPASDKLKFLLDQGFTVFCGVGGRDYLEFRKDSILMDRRQIDGLAFKYHSDLLKGLFDTNAIIDPIRPPLKPIAP